MSNNADIVVHNGGELLQIDDADSGLRDYLKKINGHEMYYFDNNGRQMLACSCNIYSKEHPLKHCDGCLAMNTVCFMLEKQQHISMDASKLKIPTHGVFYLFTNLNKIALKTTTEYDVRGDHICGLDPWRAAPDF